jgi:acyl-coenzyme A synthetase/AMP-(fatty) acid ligase
MWHWFRYDLGVRVPSRRVEPIFGVCNCAPEQDAIFARRQPLRMPQTPTNVYEAVFGALDGQHDGKAVAAIDLGKDSEPVSYAQLKHTVDVTRVTMGVKSRENVALVMPNSLELIVGLLATWAQGAATAPLNPSYTSVEFKVRIANKSGSAFQANRRSTGALR